MLVLGCAAIRVGPNTNASNNVGGGAGADHGSSDSSATATQSVFRSPGVISWSRLGVPCVFSVTIEAAHFLAAAVTASSL